MTLKLKKPRLKEIHGVLFLENRIRIGSGLGYASEIENPSDKYTDLFKNLTGEHTLDALVKRTVSTKLSKEEILEAIETLFEAGYLEDACCNVSNQLTEKELERYKVNLNFFNTFSNPNMSKYDYQIKLKNSHVIIFGLGGIGSNICMALIELGVGKITAFDFDTVELSNLNRQLLYSTDSVGKLKVEEATRRINDFNPEIEFNAFQKKISSSEDVKQLLSEHSGDVVVNVADFPTGYIDFWVNEACVNKGIPLFTALVAKKYGRSYSVVPGETACYNCQYLEELENNPKYLEELAATRVETSDGLGLYRTPNGALGPTCLFHGYFVSYEILRYLLFGSKKMLTYNKRFKIDFMTFETEFEDLKIMDSCEVCNRYKSD